MKIEWSTETPRKIQQFANPDYPTENPDLEDVLTSQDVDHVAQIFKTPLTGLRVRPDTGHRRARRRGGVARAGPGAPARSHDTPLT